jgi:hypothetical protein
MDPSEIDRLGAEFRHPVEILEPVPEEELHDVMVRFVQVLSGAVSWVLEADNPRVGAWQVAYALGLAQAAKPMSDIAADLGVERATISAGARKFLRAFDLPPSQAMRSAKAAASYRRRRTAQLKKANNGNSSSKQRKGTRG